MTTHHLPAMKHFLLGLLFGCLFVGLAWLLGSTAPTERPGPPQSSPAKDHQAQSADAPTSGSLTPRAPDPLPIREVIADSTLATGHVDLSTATLTLRIGLGYVFGEAGLRPRTDRDEVDLYCQDIRHGASLHCPRGAAPALAPMTAIGLPPTAAAAADLLLDAPTILAERNLHLASTPNPKQPGLGFVQSQSGTVYKLWLLEILGHPDALERQARIGFAAVPTVKDGGQLQLPQALGSPSAATLQHIRNAIAMGERVPGSSFHSMMDGAFTSMQSLHAETTLRDGQFVAIDELTHQKIEATGDAAIFVAGNMRTDASIVLTRGGAVGIGRDLHGVLRTDGYGYLFVGRDVTGTLDLRSYAEVVVLGDVRGTIRVRSYVSLLVRGRMLGTLDLEGSCWSTFYFQSFLGRADLERLEGTGQVTLHLRTSDLAPGRHTGIGKWREVIVGDPLWQELAK